MRRSVTNTPSMPVPLLVATAISQTQINLAAVYVGIPFASSFSFEFAAAPNGPFTAFTPPIAGAISAAFADTTLSASQTRYYRVRVLCRDGRITGYSPTVSATTQPVVVVLPPAGAYPLWTAMSLIGGNLTGYATTQFRIWASKNPLVLFGWLPGFDFSQGSSMAATMLDIKNRSSVSTKTGISHDIQIVGNPGLDQKFWNMISASKWLLYSSYPNGSLIPAGSNFYTNMTAGGPNNAAGQNIQQYDAFFQNAYMIAGDQGVITSHPNVANPYVDFVNSDDRFCQAPVGGDWNRNGTGITTATDTAIRVGNIALDAALRSITGRPVCCNIGRMTSFQPMAEYVANPTEYGFADQQVGTGFTWENNNDLATVVTAFSNMNKAVSRLAGAAHFNVRPDGSDPITFDTSPNRNPVSYSPPFQGARHAMAMFAVLSDFGYGPSATMENNCNQTPIWWDYQSVNRNNRTANAYPNVDSGLGYLGNWVDPPQTVATQNGAFRRRAQFGEVWWMSRRNPAATITFKFPDNSTRTVNKILGGQNPTYDNGAAITSQLLQSRDGIVVMYP